MKLKEAKEILKLYQIKNNKIGIKITFEQYEIMHSENFNEKVNESIEVVLKELEESKDTDIKLYKKLNMQERVIDEMAGMINTSDFGDICKQFGKYKNCSNYIKEGLCEKCIKEYFYKKVEELG